MSDESEVTCNTLCAVSYSSQSTITLAVSVSWVCHNKHSSLTVQRYQCNWLNVAQQWTNDDDTLIYQHTQHFTMTDTRWLHRHEAGPTVSKLLRKISRRFLILQQSLTISGKTLTRHNFTLGLLTDSRLRARFTNVDQAWTKFKFDLDLGLAVILVAPTQFRSNHEFNPEPPWTSDQTLIVGSTRVKQRPTATHRDPCHLCPDWRQFGIKCICVGLLHPVSGYPSLKNYFNSLIRLL